MMKIHAFRLHPKQDLKNELLLFAKRKQLKASCILTCVGSLQQASLRLSDAPTPTFYHRKFEIVSLVGTLSEFGAHLHMAISDGEGNTLGGHVMEGNIIYTTAEIVLAELTDFCFTRELDPETGFDELVIKPATV